jgi:sugar phosphate isomerase/epimerase
MRSRLGLMLYTLRADCARDFEGTLRAAREIGYEGVELFDLHGHDAHEVRALLDELGLTVCGRHASLEAIESDLGGLAGELRAVGSDRLVLAWIEPPATAHEADAVVARIAALAKRVRAAGLRLGFHNHDGELRPLDDGRTVLDRLVELGEEQLFFEVDLGWAWFAGVEPASLLERLAPRVPLVHVKDLAPRAEHRFVPVGDGDVGYRELLPAIEGRGIDWLLVEQDEVGEHGLDAVRRSFAAITDMVGTPA